MSEESIKMEEGGDLNLDSTENLADTGAINEKMITIIKLTKRKRQIKLGKIAWALILQKF